MLSKEFYRASTVYLPLKSEISTVFYNYVDASIMTNLHCVYSRYCTFRKMVLKMHPCTCFT